MRCAARSYRDRAAGVTHRDRPSVHAARDDLDARRGARGEECKQRQPVERRPVGQADGHRDVARRFAGRAPAPRVATATSGRHRRHGRKPAASAAARDANQRTFSGRGGFTRQVGRQ